MDMAKIHYSEKYKVSQGKILACGVKCRGNETEASPGGEDILHSPVMSCGNICGMLSTQEACRDLVSKFLN